MNIRRLALAGLVCACAGTRPAPRAGGPNVVTITATDYAFGVPDTIPAGLTTFRLANQGKELHHASVVRLGRGKTVADFQAGLEAAMKDHTPPALPMSGKRRRATSWHSDPAAEMELPGP